MTSPKEQSSAHSPSDAWGDVLTGSPGHSQSSSPAGSRGASPARSLPSSISNSPIQSVKQIDSISALRDEHRELVRAEREKKHSRAGSPPLSSLGSGNGVLSEGKSSLHLSHDNKDKDEGSGSPRTALSRSPSLGHGTAPGVSFVTRRASVESGHSHSSSSATTTTSTVNTSRAQVVSRPENVTRVIHVEWDEKLGAFTGVPDVWKRIMPQGADSLETEGLPSHITPRVLSKEEQKRAKTRADASDLAHRSLPGKPKQKKDRPRVDFSPTIPLTAYAPKITVKDFLKNLGFTDLNRLYDPNMLRESLVFKLSLGPGGGTLIRVPYVIKLKILQFLDVSSLVSACSTCTEMLQLAENRLLWKPLVDYKNKLQRTLYSDVSHDWKRTYMAMHNLDTAPKYFDFLWNVVVIGDRRVGKSRLVHALAESASKAKQQRAVVGDDPVIDAVSGIYRLGIDFVTRRVVIDSTIIKLQVWDGNALGTRVPFNQAHVVLIVFDVTKKASFDAVPNIIAEARKSLSEVDAGGASILIFGNTATARTRDARAVSYKDAKRFANERGMVYLEANANDVQSVDLAFARLAVECLNNVEGKVAPKQSPEKSLCLIM